MHRYELAAKPNLPFMSLNNYDPAAVDFIAQTFSAHEATVAQVGEWDAELGSRRY